MVVGAHACNGMGRYRGKPGSPDLLFSALARRRVGDRPPDKQGQVDPVTACSLQFVRLNYSVPGP